MIDYSKQYPKLKTFAKHGVIYTDESSSSQVVGDCIFCGSEGHFYTNYSNRLWDCKICQRSGNINSFFMEVIKNYKPFLKGKSLNALSVDRSLSNKTFKRNNIAFNPITEEYLIPVYNKDNSSVIDIKTYKIGSRVFASPGSKTGLLNANNIINNDKKVYIMEGEWDFLAMDEIIHNNNLQDEVVAVAVPGAGTFKNEWVRLFDRKIVKVIFDNDKAGVEGEIKINKLLKSNAKDITFTHWEVKRKKGFDFRDYYICNKLNGKKTLRRLNKLSSPVCREIIDNTSDSKSEGTDSNNEDTLENKKNKKNKNKKLGKGLIYSEIVKRYRKWLHIPDDRVIATILGATVANILPGDPIWLFLVAPPGGTKTELLMSLNDSENVITTTSLTPHSLISGFNGGGGDPSLIPKLDGKVLIIKDFTTILNMPFVFREEIFGILRDAYDGQTEKVFGNGVLRAYKSKFGILGGVTPVIDSLSEEHASLGERFLKFRVRFPECVNQGTDFIRRALGNIAKEDTMRKELNSIAVETLNYNFKKIPTVPDRYIEKYIRLAQWTAIMRASVTREKYSGEINYKPTPELGTRLVKQFTKLSMGIAMIRRESKVTDFEYDISCRVAKDTISGKVEEAFRKIYTLGKDKIWSSGDLSNVIKLPRITCNRLLEDLTMNRVMVKKEVKNESSNFKMSYGWKLTKGIKELIEPLKLYKVKKEKK